MTITIHNYQFPEAIVEGARGGPRFSRTVLIGSTGVAYINENWSRPLWSYTVEIGEPSDDKVMLVRDLFMITRGGADGFLFKDPRDHTATAQPVIGGDLYRRYSIAGEDFDRLITRPVAGYSSGGGTWTGEFLIPVRIDTDVLDLNVVLENMAGIPSLPLIEVLET